MLSKAEGENALAWTFSYRGDEIAARVQRQKEIHYRYIFGCTDNNEGRKWHRGALRERVKGTATPTVGRRQQRWDWGRDERRT